MDEYDYKFKDWMVSVDFWCNRIAGLSVHDLPDCQFADWFEDGMRAQTAARRAIKAAQE